MKRYYLLFFFAFLISTATSFGQKIKYGKISEIELLETEHPLEKDTDAAYLLHKRRIEFSYTSGEGFKLEDNYHIRIKIYTKEGYEWAKKKIYLYGKGGVDEKIYGLKGATYNLENGEIVKSKLKTDGIFKTEVTEHLSSKTFTMPNVKVGSVLEFKYKVISPYIASLDPSKIQYGIPIKRLDHMATIPVFYQFNLNKSGFEQFDIKSELISQRSGTLTHNSMRYSIDKNNIPSLKKEPFVSNIDNYRSKLIFELRSIKIPNSTIKNFASDWESVCQKVFKNAKFGLQLNKSNYFKEDLESLLQGDLDTKTRIEKIVSFVKEKVKWNEHHGIFSRQGVKKAYQNGAGNVAEINFILIAMLREAGFNAHPVLISTKDHGITYFPSIDGFNYVIAAIEYDNETYTLLDASAEHSYINILPHKVLNWKGRLVKANRKTAEIDLPSYIVADETKVINLKMTEEGLISGYSKTTLQNHAAYDYRNENKNVTKEQRISTIGNNITAIEVTNIRISNIGDLSKPIKETYAFESEELVQNIGNEYYISPLSTWGITKNPLTKETRNFPIEFKTAWKETIHIHITIPDGFTPKNLPEETVYQLPENIGSFTYKTSFVNQKIVIQSEITYHSSIISANYYPQLKEMFEQIVAKNKEQITIVKQ